MTRKEFEKYIEENKLTALFTRDKDSLYGQDIILTYCDFDKAVYTGAYGCIHDEKGYKLDSRVYGEQINIIAKEHIKILSVGRAYSKAVYWEFEDRKFIMFNELNGTFCDYKCDESGIYTLYYNSIYLLIKYSYDGSILYSLNRGSFNDDDLFDPKFFSTFPVFDEKYPNKKYLGISNGTSTIIFERETGKIVYGVKTEWNKV